MSLFKIRQCVGLYEPQRCFRCHDVLDHVGQDYPEVSQAYSWIRCPHLGLDQCRGKCSWQKQIKSNAETHLLAFSYFWDTGQEVVCQVPLGTSGRYSLFGLGRSFEACRARPRFPQARPVRIHRRESILGSTDASTNRSLISSRISVGGRFPQVGLWGAGHP